MLRIKNAPIKWHNSLFYAVGLTFLILNTSIYNGTFDPEFKRFIFYGIASFLVLGSLTLNEFKRVYLNVVCCISILSLIIFSSSLVVNLPLQYIVGDYVTIGHYMYHAIEWNNGPLGRNTSFFSEPGCFQYCLNYTFLLYIEDFINNKLSRFDKVKLFIVTTALITCASTTGYLVFVVILCYVLIKHKSKNKFKYLLLVLPFTAILLSIMYSSENLQSKIDSDEENLSVVMRAADALAMSQMIYDHPFVGNGGVGTKEYKKRVLGYGALTADTGASNGILVGMAVLGVFWLILYLYFCNKACKQMYTEVPSWLVVILTLLVHTNEYFVFYPLVYLFIFPYKPQTTANLICAR